MAYYLDTCDGSLVEYSNDELPYAIEQAERALESARDFQAKTGFRPFWADAVEIRKGPKKLGADWHGYGEARNAAIVEGSKVFKRFSA